MSIVRVIVDARVRVLKQDLGPVLTDALRKLHEHKNPQHEKLMRMGYRFDHRKEPRVIRTWRDEGQWLSLPRGGMARTRVLLYENGLELRARDERSRGSYTPKKGFVWPTYQRTLYPDQETTLAAILERETCYLRAPTAAGKTEICLAAIATVQFPGLIIVWTGSLFDQWLERIVLGLGMRQRDIGQVRGGKKTIGIVTVAMQQTLAKIPPGDPFWGFFGIVIADELQRFSAPTFIASIDPFPARYRIGASADERRADKKEFLAHDVFADLAISIDRKELVAAGRVRDVEVRVVPTGWWSSLPPGLGMADEIYKLWLDEMTVSDVRDNIVLRIIEEERAKGEQIIVFSLRTEHCRRLVGLLASAGVNAGLMIGGVENREARQEAIKAMRAGKMRVGVGTIQAVGTGVDLPSVGVGILAMPGVRNRQLFGQIAGRVSRLGQRTEVDGPARLYCLCDPESAKLDYPAFFDDGRPVKVLLPDGAWMDASAHRRKARVFVVPLAAS